MLIIVVVELHLKYTQLPLISVVCTTGSQAMVWGKSYGCYGYCKTE